MRTLVTTDTHGCFKGLVQALERANFDPASDRLIHLGDVADGWPDVRESVQFLIDHATISLRGNHDQWTHEWMSSHPDMLGAGTFGDSYFKNWYNQGGEATLNSYGNSYKNVPDSHKEFFINQLPFYVDEQNRAFVHAGWDYTLGDVRNVVEEDYDSLWWNRSMYYRARDLHFIKSYKKETFLDHPEVFIGHTSNDRGPVFYCGVWNLDSGAGWSGCVTVMDVDTKECWKSDRSFDLYPHDKGRHG